MSRLDAIRAYKKNQDILKANAEIEKENKINELVKHVQALKPRIDELLETANVCHENDIELNTYGKSFSRDLDSYENGTFIANGVSHKLGFISPFQTGKEFKFLGIEAGGACGNFDFRTDGIQAFSVDENDKRKMSQPLIKHLNQFLADFDAFETAFYSYIDKIIERSEPVEPIQTEILAVPKPDADRLEVLLYNAIICLEEYGCDRAQLKDNIGISEQEYKVVMREIPSLDAQIAKANAQPPNKKNKRKEKNIKNNRER